MAEYTIIKLVAWGRMEVTIDGQIFEFKDCKVWPGGGRVWDWRETGTHHQPGIQPADIQEILNQDVEVMVLGRGMELRLATTQEVRNLLEERGIEYFIEETRQAVARFNKLAEEGKKVGGIFHSTC